jgi:hypothetical protein
LVAAAAVVEQVLVHHIPTLVEEEVQVHIEQIQLQFLDHKQYPFKLVLVELEHMLLQREDRE